MGDGELFKGDVDPFMEMGSVDRECSGAWRSDGAVLPSLLWELDKRERTLASKLISLDGLSIIRPQLLTALYKQPGSTRISVRLPRMSWGAIPNDGDLVLPFALGGLLRADQSSAVSAASPSPSGDPIIASATRPAFSRIFTSITSAMSGFDFRKVRAFSLPCPIR
jgi:hypothetical protein